MKSFEIRISGQTTCSQKDIEVLVEGFFNSFPEQFSLKEYDIVLKQIEKPSIVIQLINRLLMKQLSSAQFKIYIQHERIFCKPFRFNEN